MSRQKEICADMATNMVCGTSRSVQRANGGPGGSGFPGPNSTNLTRCFYCCLPCGEHISSCFVIRANPRLRKLWSRGYIQGKKGEEQELAASSYRMGWIKGRIEWAARHNQRMR